MDNGYSNLFRTLKCCMAYMYIVRVTQKYSVNEPQSLQRQLLNSRQKHTS